MGGVTRSALMFSHSLTDGEIRSPKGGLHEKFRLQAKICKLLSNKLIVPPIQLPLESQNISHHDISNMLESDLKRPKRVSCNSSLEGFPVSSSTA